MAIENLSSADGTAVRLPEFDEAGGTNQVTTGQQQCALAALKRVCTDWAFTKGFLERLLHAPKLFLQVLADGMVATFDQQLHLTWSTGHLTFILTLDSLLPGLSACPTDAPVGCLGVL